ncbi:TPA: hypothetical protein H1011_00310 [archaeon]|jgi:hypothetical protein|uniref:Uncharacterized protein n=1 Tax=Candidatus Undinarchaeum marinum TaxID=2756141 RepID=A0A832X4W2_9ARCH|nr:hypothetical protein [Candidatus Undinarchaeum marinum]
MGFYNRKGSTAIFEQVCFAVMGVFIFVMFLTVFGGIKDDMSDFQAGHQFRNVASYVHLAISNSYIYGRYVDNYSLNIELPPYLAGRRYVIITNNTSILVRDEFYDINRTLPILKFNISINGSFSSTAGGQHRIAYNSTAGIMVLEDV